jgi:hypothetical protein
MVPCILVPPFVVFAGSALRPLGAASKSKVVTGAPSYSLSWTFLTPCILVPPFVLFAGLGHRWRALADGRSSKK